MNIDIFYISLVQNYVKYIILPFEMCLSIAHCLSIHSSSLFKLYVAYTQSLLTEMRFAYHCYIQPLPLDLHVAYSSYTQSLLTKTRLAYTKSLLTAMRFCLSQLYTISPFWIVHCLTLYIITDKGFNSITYRCLQIEARLVATDTFKQNEKLNT